MVGTNAFNPNPCPCCCALVCMVLYFLHFSSPFSFCSVNFILHNLPILASFGNHNYVCFFFCLSLIYRDDEGLRGIGWEGLNWMHSHSGQTNGKQHWDTTLAPGIFITHSIKCNGQRQDPLPLQLQDMHVLLFVVCCLLFSADSPRSKQL